MKRRARVGRVQRRRLLAAQPHHAQAGDLQAAAGGGDRAEDAAGVADGVWLDEAERPARARGGKEVAGKQRPATRGSRR
jgi:hypothetical protein